MDKRSLLPPNASQLERAFEHATDKLSAPDSHTLWNAHDCPEKLLPWLAWAMGVEVWDDNWPVSIKRSTIAAAMKIARHRGSVWAVKEALIAAGYAGADIEEGLPPVRHNGAQLRDGLENYGSGNRWAMFRLIADLGENKGVSGKELAQLTELINNAKPARSQLTEIEYRASVTDVASPSEASYITGQPHFGDVRPAGRRRDASLLRSNAIKSPPESTYRNARWARNSEIARTGVSPYYQWEVTGENRQNRWEVAAVAADYTFSEQLAVEDPLRTGKAQRDGAFVRGAALPWAYDRIAVTASPALSDVAMPSEASYITGQPRISDVRPAGRRRDGSLARNNATKLPPAPTRRDGQWMRNNLIARTGVSPYFDWVITGENRENRWEAAQLDVLQNVREAPAAPSLPRDARYRRDGKPRRGSPNPPALEAATLKISRRQRRNARLARNAAAPRVANYHQYLTM